MCYHTIQTKTVEQLEQRFQAKFELPLSFQPSVYNGFEHPKTPLITNEKKEQIQLYEWGLLPHWAKDSSIAKSTLNARVETIAEKASFRASTNNRCLVLVDGFFEWQWLDEKGRKKQKFLIRKKGEEAFAFAGLWNHWIDKSTGEIRKTYTILTTEANALMAEIHNSKKRMPFILPKEEEQNWLFGKEVHMREIELIATEA